MNGEPSLTGVWLESGSVLRQAASRLCVSETRVGDPIENDPVPGGRSFHTRFKSFGKIHGRIEGKSVAAIICVVQKTVEIKVFKDVSGL